MTSRTFRRAHHPEEGGLTASEIGLLQLAQIRDISPRTVPANSLDIRRLVALGCLRAVDNRTPRPQTVSFDEQFTITASGLAWLREHGFDDDWLCPCPACAGRG